MAHWRDGGIGNMAGSDDRPIEEWTLLEKLASIATAEIGGPMPACLRHPTTAPDLVTTDPVSGVSVGLGTNDWGTPLSAIVQDAFDEIQRLRERLQEIDDDCKDRETRT